VLVGPFTPGFEADPTLAPQLAEIGVILLMFGVGIHFSFKKLMDVRGVAIPGAIVQSTAATIFAVAVTMWWGWDWRAGIVLGLALSVASTVVLLRALITQDLLDSAQGRIAVGWLIVEDLLTVLALVLLPMLAPDASTTPDAVLTTLAVTLGKVALLVVGVLFIGMRVVPWLLVQVAKTGSRELFTLCVLALAFGMAFSSAALFGVSMALGAFLAGLVMGESELSHRAAEEALPMRDAFAVLFFTSVGMLFDPSVIVQYPLELLAVLLIVIVVKPAAAFALVRVLRRPHRTGLVVGAGLAQIGEFSFILAELGRSLQILPPAGHSLILAAAIVSIAINPLAFVIIEPLDALLRRWRATPTEADAAPSSTDIPVLREHAVLCGYGRVGRLVGEALTREGVPYLVVEQDGAKVAQLRDEGIAAVHGDAAEPGLQSLMRFADARLLVLAIPDPIATRQISAVARRQNALLPIIARTHSEEEWARLISDGRVNAAVFAEYEVAQAMVRVAVQQLNGNR